MGRFLTQDPIGLAGGANLYAYAGNNPVAFKDPFGLCAEQPDSIQIQVIRECVTFNGLRTADGLSLETDTVTVWAHRVTNSKDLNALAGVIGGLSGGSAAYSAANVQSAYAPIMSSGMYTFKVPGFGQPGSGSWAADAGQTNGNVGVVALRDDVWRYMSTSTACEIVAHEGVHLVQHSRGRRPGTPGNESAAGRAQTMFGC